MRFTKKSAGAEDTVREVYEVGDVSAKDIERPDNRFLRFVREELQGMSFLNSLTMAELEASARYQFTSDRERHIED
jgi:hypothetical protein